MMNGKVPGGRKVSYSYKFVFFCILFSCTCSGGEILLAYGEIPACARYHSLWFRLSPNECDCLWRIYGKPWVVSMSMHIIMHEWRGICSSPISAARSERFVRSKHVWYPNITGRALPTQPHFSQIADMQSYSVQAPWNRDFFARTGKLVDEYSFRKQRNAQQLDDVVRIGRQPRCRWKIDTVRARTRVIANHLVGDRGAAATDTHNNQSNR